MRPIGESLIKILTKVKTNRDGKAYQNDINSIKYLRN